MKQDEKWLADRARHLLDPLFRLKRARQMLGPGQYFDVAVKIRQGPVAEVRLQSDEFSLNEADWERILSIGWRAKFRHVLETMRRLGNPPLALAELEKARQEGPPPNSERGSDPFFWGDRDYVTTRLRRHKLPYVLASVDRMGKKMRMRRR